MKSVLLEVEVKDEFDTAGVLQAQKASNMTLALLWVSERLKNIVIQEKLEHVNLTAEEAELFKRFWYLFESELEELDINMEELI